MNKKYLMKGLTALALIVSFASCVKDVEGITPAEEAEKEKENAELQLGLKIPEGQTWEMAEQVTANVNVNKKAGETYRVTVYSNNPLIEGKGVFLARGTINNGETFKGKFTCGAGVQSLYVGLTDSQGYTVYKQAKVENGRLDLTFGNVGAAASRAYTIKGDEYEQFTFPTEEELAAVFPTAIPSGADEIANLTGDLYWVYRNNGDGHNYKVTTTGEVSIGGSYDCKLEDGSYICYNVYVNVAGSVTLKRNGPEKLNLYILGGNVTLDSNWGECGGIISVAAGATLNDARTKIQHNDRIKLYNRGIVNATNGQGYDIGNNACVYNEGAFSVTGPLTYSAGSNLTSYFYNLGNNIEVNGEEVAKLTAPSMTLNSTCNFITNGDVVIAGQTAVTKDGIVWVNNGKYQTGSMRFSASNSTFYNYCQLLVTGDMFFLDGEFNMMTGSYAKMNRGLFQNFIVNMAANSGIEIVSGTKWGRQQQSKYQGFRAVDDYAAAYVRLGGEQYVPAFKGYAFQLDGANLTAAIENMKFYKQIYSDIGQYSNYDDISYGVEVTEESLVAEGNEDRTWNIHNADVTGISAIEVEEPAEGECSATWKKKKYETDDRYHIFTYAFEDQKFNGDYDMNDVVLKVTFPVTKWDENGKPAEFDYDQLQITMVAAGATFDIKAFVGEGEKQIALFGGKEIHDAFGVNRGVMVNTGNNKAQTAIPVKDIIDTPAGFVTKDGEGNINIDFTKLDIWIWVNPESGKTSETKIKYLEEKTAPFAVMVPEDWRWPLERICITEAYPSFAEWAETLNRTPEMNMWYKNPVIGKTMTNE